jgi:large subunit ribosomal protein L24
MRIRKGDLVEKISGRQRGLKGAVLRVLTDKNKVVVEGLNQVYKHLRRSQKNPQGGRLQKEAPIAMSNVMPVCPKCNRGVRIGYQTKDDGKKVRICRVCKAELGKA